MTPEVKSMIEAEIAKAPVVLFMKGSSDFPQCGFSGKVVQILDMMGVEFHDVNVLDNWDIREGIKAYSDWPTIPQLYVNNEFVGGCDIISEMFEDGDLQKLLQK